MKVWGQLEGAQLEQFAGAPTPTPTGRIYMDITVPAAAVPYIFNGTSWRPLSYGQATATIAQNSGKACTVDWSQGLAQQVTLTDNCVISFSNPVSGAEHSLIVTQAPANVGGPNQYNFSFDMPNQDSRTTPYQPLNIQQGDNAVFRWFYKVGIRPGYANIPAQNFAFQGPPPSASSGIAISPLEEFTVMGRATTPFLNMNSLTKVNTLMQTPVGGTMVPPALVPAAAPTGIAMSPNGKVIFTANGTTPFVSANSVIGGNSGGTYAAPTALAGAGQSICVHPNGSVVAVGHTTTPFISVLPWTGGGWGLKLTNPAALPPAAVTGCAFSRQGDFLAAASKTTPFINVWAFSAINGFPAFGAASSNPAVLPVDGPTGQLGKGICWRPQGDYIAMAMGTTPFIYVVPFNRATGTFGTPLTVTTLPGATAGVCVQFTPCGNYLCVGGVNYFTVYDFSGKLLNTVVPFDGAGISAQVNDIDINVSGDYIVLALNTGAFGMMYSLPWKTKDYLRII